MSSIRDTLVDLTAGVIGGCSGIIVGQPFDTIKVRLQTHSDFYKGPLDCAKQTFRNEGFKGFFKGLTSPLIGNGWSNAIIFGTYGSTIRLLEGTTEKPQISSVLWAGAFSGLVQTLVLCPSELIKCRLQVQDGHSSNHYKGPMDCIKHIYDKNGIRGLYLGWWPTIYREVPAFGAYFFVYENIKRRFTEENKEPNHSVLLTAGGMAGVASWALCYPMDVIKSSIQTLPEDSPAHHKTISYQFSKLYKKNGLKIFTNGLGTTIFRAFPVNAVTLAIYEQSVRSLNEKPDSIKMMNI